jgi:hypothetical protein
LLRQKIKGVAMLSNEPADCIRCKRWERPLLRLSRSDTKEDAEGAQSFRRWKSRELLERVAGCRTACGCARPRQYGNEAMFDLVREGGGVHCFK